MTIAVCWAVRVESVQITVWTAQGRFLCFASSFCKFPSQSMVVRFALFFCFPCSDWKRNLTIVAENRSWLSIFVITDAGGNSSVLYKEILFLFFPKERKRLCIVKDLQKADSLQSCTRSPFSNERPREAYGERRPENFLIHVWFFFSSIKGNAGSQSPVYRPKNGNIYRTNNQNYRQKENRIQQSALAKVILSPYMYACMGLWRGKRAICKQKEGSSVYSFWNVDALKKLTLLKVRNGAEKRHSPRPPSGSQALDHSSTAIR